MPFESTPGHFRAANVRAMAEAPFGAQAPLLIVAAATPLTDGGSALDEAAIWPYVSFLTDGGADGIFACGTTGEGVLLTTDLPRGAAGNAYRPRRGADDAGHRRPRGACSRDRRRCGCGHSASLLPAR
ncbi:MAG: hypothetical protein E6J39_10505 [Chloroflexi bacterium]|nr:MAG: hypothetical protein E6J39_10505 [Chloroflexota bacterium]